MCVVVLCSESVPWGWTVANLLVFRKVREALGFQRCKRFSVGAAPIKMETMEYFMSLNIPIMPMYGMSCVAITSTQYRGTSQYPIMPIYSMVCTRLVICVKYRGTSLCSRSWYISNVENVGHVKYVLYVVDQCSCG